MRLNFYETRVVGNVTIARSVLPYTSQCDSSLTRILVSASGRQVPGARRRIASAVSYGVPMLIFALLGITG
jgi:hypothetical protein